MIQLGFNSLLFNSRVTVVIIGAGGTGSHVMDVIYRIYNVSELFRTSLKKVIIVDGDIVSNNNLIRQNFYSTDVSRPKAEVIANRYQKVMPEVSFIAVKKYLREVPDNESITINKIVELMSIDESQIFRKNINFFIMCTDNVDSRAYIQNSFFSRIKFIDIFKFMAQNQDILAELYNKLLPETGTKKCNKLINKLYEKLFSFANIDVKSKFRYRIIGSHRKLSSDEILRLAINLNLLTFFPQEIKLDTLYRSSLVNSLNYFVDLGNAQNFGQLRSACIVGPIAKLDSNTNIYKDYNNLLIANINQKCIVKDCKGKLTSKKIYYLNNFEHIYAFDAYEYNDMLDLYIDYSVNKTNRINEFYNILNEKLISNPGINNSEHSPEYRIKVFQVENNIIHHPYNNVIAVSEFNKSYTGKINNIFNAFKSLINFNKNHLMLNLIFNDDNYSDDIQTNRDSNICTSNIPQAIFINREMSNLLLKWFEALLLDRPFDTAYFEFSNAKDIIYKSSSIDEFDKKIFA